MKVMLDLISLHLTVALEKAALFRMAQNVVGGGMLIIRRAWTCEDGLSKSIPHLTYPKDETIRKFNFGSTFFTKLRKSEWINVSVTYRLGEHTVK